MAQKRIDMRKVRELLRLNFEQNISARQGAKILGIGKTTASEYIAGFKASKIPYSIISAMSDTELLQAISCKKGSENIRFKTLSDQFSYIEKELKRTGVTLHLLWQEYKEKHDDCYGYSQYCHHYMQWRKQQKVSMRIEHKAGDKMYVDFTGKKLKYYSSKEGDFIEVEVFVSVLGSSQYSYIEAVSSQTKADWIKVNQNALGFYGGVPAAIVPDCLKSAVVKSDKYEPEINESFNDFASHNNTVILPARALHPKDKSLAENFVKNAYTHIYAPLRNRTFFSLEELNEALWAQLDIYNKRLFQGKEFSRLQLFEEVEKDQLKPLPTQGYELKDFSKAKVQYNHHIYFKQDKHYYSVPFQFTGKMVTVISTSLNIEIYYNNNRIAMHKRNRSIYGYTTDGSHRPKNHQYISEWNAERFIKWARSVSNDTEKLIAMVIESRKHPEQAFKSCMGIMNLLKKHAKEDFISACNKALNLNNTTYKFIKNTLHNKTFNLNDEEQLENFSISEHDNIRGKKMYN